MRWLPGGGYLTNMNLSCCRETVIKSVRSPLVAFLATCTHYCLCSWHMNAVNEKHRAPGSDGHNQPLESLNQRGSQREALEDGHWLSNLSGLKTKSSIYWTVQPGRLESAESVAQSSSQLHELLSFSPFLARRFNKKIRLYSIACNVWRVDENQIYFHNAFSSQFALIHESCTQLAGVWNDVGAKPDLSRNAADMYLVESRGFSWGAHQCMLMSLYEAM